MSRRAVTSSVLLVALAANVMSAMAADPPPRPEKPRAACPQRVADPEGDAAVEYAGQTALKSTTGSIPGLDLTGLHLRLTADQLQVFLAAKDIPTPAELRDLDTAFMYTVNFKHGAKTFTFAIQLRNPDHGEWFPTNKAAYPAGNTGTAAADQLKGEGFYAQIWDDVNYVVFAASRARVEKNLDTTLKDGDKFESLTAIAEHYTADSRYKADEIRPATAVSWTVGDESCFGAPPGVLSDLVAPAARFGDPVTLSAKLVDEAGAAVADKTLSFAVEGETAPVTAVTGTDGIAKATYVPTVAAGTKTVTVSFGGDQAVGKATLAGTIAVAAEATKFAALAVARTSATARSVTATLLDDDGKALAGQKVDFYVNGRKVATVVTAATGKALYKGAKAGQTVQARFAGLAGKYLAAASATKKV